jgi:hypothetical protein
MSQSKNTFQQNHKKDADKDAAHFSRSPLQHIFSGHSTWTLSLFSTATQPFACLSIFLLHFPSLFLHALFPLFLAPCAAMPLGEYAGVRLIPDTMDGAFLTQFVIADGESTFADDALDLKERTDIISETTCVCCVQCAQLFVLSKHETPLHIYASPTIAQRYANEIAVVRLMNQTSQSTVPLATCHRILHAKETSCVCKCVSKHISARLVCSKCACDCAITSCAVCIANAVDCTKHEGNGHLELACLGKRTKDKEGKTK